MTTTTTAEPYWTKPRCGAMRQSFFLATPAPKSATHGPPFWRDGEPLTAALWVTPSGRVTPGRDAHDAYRAALFAALRAWEARVSADPDAGPESTPYTDPHVRDVRDGGPVAISGDVQRVLALLRGHGFEPRGWPWR